MAAIDFAPVRSRRDFMSFDSGGPVKRMGCCGLKWEREKPSKIAPDGSPMIKVIT
jgi:hypothetical protein